MFRLHCPLVDLTLHWPLHWPRRLQALLLSELGHDAEAERVEKTFTNDLPSERVTEDQDPLKQVIENSARAH